LYNVHNNFVSYINTVLHSVMGWLDCIDSEKDLEGKNKSKAQRWTNG